MKDRIKWLKSQWKIIQQLKRHTNSLSQDMCMDRPPKMAVLLFSIHPLLDQCLLHLNLRLADLPTGLPQAPANGCSNFNHHDGLLKAQ